MRFVAPNVVPLRNTVVCLFVLTSSSLFSLPHCGCPEYPEGINLIVAPCIFRRITSIYQPTNAHIISYKTLLKRFKTLRHVSILSDHHQGALFLVRVILQYSQFNSYLQTRCCGSISCCVGMCCGAVARCASYDAHPATVPQHIPTQYIMLPQHLVCKCELNCEYCNITLARNKAP